MIKQTHSSIFLLICLYLSSLVVLPMIHAVGSPIMEMSANHTEQGSLLEQLEIEDDLVLALSSGARITLLSFSKHGAAQLGFQSALLAPVIPPPKPA